MYTIVFVWCILIINIIYNIATLGGDLYYTLEGLFGTKRRKFFLLFLFKFAFWWGGPTLPKRFFGGTNPQFP